VDCSWIWSRFTRRHAFAVHRVGRSLPQHPSCSSCQSTTPPRPSCTPPGTIKAATHMDAFSLPVFELRERAIDPSLSVRTMVLFNVSFFFFLSLVSVFSSVSRVLLFAFCCFRLGNAMLKSVLSAILSPLFWLVWTLVVESTFLSKQLHPPLLCVFGRLYFLVLHHAVFAFAHAAYRSPLFILRFCA
jgi:hypothetical protein